jgi:UDP-glucose 4-epimerase
MRVLVTGASGFIGGRLCARLRRDGVEVRAALRRPAAVPGAECVAVGEVGPATDWRPALRGVDVVVHLAGRAHVMREEAADPLAEYRRVNVEGTRRLAQQAAEAGVRRVVFVSSIKVNGEATPPGAAFRAEDDPAPRDPYGVSKREAEEALAGVPGIQTVTVRPPLVYGPGVRANFRRLMQAVARGVPLPLGAVRNRRSLVYVDNLADALAVCATHPEAAGQVFLVSDGPALSTAELVRGVARALGRPARLLPVPAAALRAAGRLAGVRGAVERLCGSLVVDDGPIRRRLGWTPPHAVEAALAATARAFREERG